MVVVEDLAHFSTSSREEIPLHAWLLLLPQIQEFLDYNPANVPITGNQLITMKMKHEILSTVGAQEIDKSEYILSKLGDIDFRCWNAQLQLDADFRLVMDRLFCRQSLMIQWRIQQKTPLYWTSKRTNWTRLLQIQRLKNRHSLSRGSENALLTSENAPKILCLSLLDSVFFGVGGFSRIVDKVIQLCIFLL